jgi:L,D-peptidoglycan transpeptidase YkuD (ErfK/YbiS/YcfS/YnhG family)
VLPAGRLIYRGREYRCSLGRSGVTLDKREGDGATPMGCFPIREVFYRADRVRRPDCPFPARPISHKHGWSEDPEDPAYNQLVELPHGRTVDRLWRDDHIYDVIVVLGYNDRPPLPGRGSAIFLHVSRPNYSPTLGCVAMSLDDLMRLIETIQEDTQVCVRAS